MMFVLSLKEKIVTKIESQVSQMIKMSKYYLQLLGFFSLKSSFFFGAFCWYFLYEVIASDDMTIRGITIQRGDGSFLFTIFEIFVFFWAVIFTCFFISHSKKLFIRNK